MTLLVRTGTPSDAADVARLCWAYRDILLERSAGLPPVLEAYCAADNYAALIDDLPRIHARPGGEILLVERNGCVVGCAMYYPLEIPGVTEIKRVFVDPDARRSGAGRALMQAGMAHAAADGYSRMVLDTIAPLTEAILLYERLGFTPCAPFYDPDPEFAPFLRFFDHPL